MFIIFGFGHQTVNSLDIEKKDTCRNCHNEVSLRLLKVTNWFTLFFIPLIPYKTQYYLACPICRNGYPLTKEQFYEFKQGTAMEAEMEADVKYKGKNETQIAFLKAMEESKKAGS